VILCTCSGFYFSWQKIKDYYNINNRSILVAGAAATLTHLTKVLNYNGDSSFLYQTNRKGWQFSRPLPVMIQKGADYLVLINPTEKDDVFKKDYAVVEQTKEYVIFNLRKKKV
jgi:hypothetical protein